jgi:hypothetical protein
LNDTNESSKNDRVALSERIKAQGSLHPLQFLPQNRKNAPEDLTLNRLVADRWA